MKAAARRAAFTDVSNSRAQPVAVNVKAKTGKVDAVVQQKGNAISKPAQRVPGLKNTSKQQTAPAPAAVQRPAVAQAGPRRATHKPAVYQDNKRPSPKRVSPKVARNGVKKSAPPARTASSRSLRREASNLNRIIKDDDVVYSDQQPHLFDPQYIADDNDQPDADDEEDLTEPELDEIVKPGSDYDTAEEEDDEDETDYHRPTGDNTTGVTTQAILPKWTTKAKKQIEELHAEFAPLDQEDEGDISMVAEYGEEIFQYMRDLEVCFHIYAPLQRVV